MSYKYLSFMHMIFKFQKNWYLCLKFFIEFNMATHFTLFWNSKSVDKGCVIPIKTFRFCSCVAVKVNLESFCINNNFTSHTSIFFEKQKEDFSNKTNWNSFQAENNMQYLSKHLLFGHHFKSNHWNFSTQKLGLYYTSLNDLFSCQLSN